GSRRRARLWACQRRPTTDGSGRSRPANVVRVRRASSQLRNARLYSRCCNEPEFVDLAPGQVYAQLLDAERYLCSERTMYRILEENHEVRERRDQLRHPHYPAPDLLATAPSQVWSWDITTMLGTA